VAAAVAAGWAPILSGIELRSGTQGVFKVSLDGVLLFDKAHSGYLPNADEVANLVQARVGDRLRWRKSDQK
jgi:predicted Rdx family selenoprotein